MLDSEKRRNTFSTFFFFVFNQNDKDQVVVLNTLCRFLSPVDEFDLVSVNFTVFDLDY